MCAAVVILIERKLMEYAANPQRWLFVLVSSVRWAEQVLIKGTLVVRAFSSPERILGDCSTIHSPPAIFCLFVEVAISSRTLIPLFRPGSVHTVAQRAETTVAECSLTSCV